MGVLDVTGATGEEHIDAPAEGADDAAPAPERERNEQGQFVPAEKLQPETPQSRRDKQWQERVAAAFEPLKKDFEGKLTASQQALEELRQQRLQDQQERARLQGMLEAMQRQPPQQQQQQPAGPDPEKLFEEATAALNANDFGAYQSKQRAAFAALANRQAQEAVRMAREEWQKSQPPQIPPHIQVLLMQNPNVAAAGDRGIRKVLRTADDLADDGMDRQQALTEAFRRTNESLKPKTAPAPQQFTSQAASALAGVPTGRPGPTGGGGKQDGVQLTAAQEAAYQATKSQWKDRAEYLQWSTPGKYGLG